MAAGHVLSIGLTAASVMTLGTFVGRADLRLVAGGLLILWAGYHWRYSHRHRVRVGLTAGLSGLALWSFLMASAHGAGLMLVPALLPLCVGARLSSSGSLLRALASVGVHTLALLAVTGLIALVVHDWLGLAVRSARRCARPGGAAPWPCSSASAALHMGGVPPGNPTRFTPPAFHWMAHANIAMCRTPPGAEPRRRERADEHSPLRRVGPDEG